MPSKFSLPREYLRDISQKLTLETAFTESGSPRISKAASDILKAPKFAKHFSRTCDDIGTARKFVVYGGDEEFPAGDDITMISLPGIMERLIEAGRHPGIRRRHPSLN